MEHYSLGKEQKPQNSLHSNWLHFCPMEGQRIAKATVVGNDQTWGTNYSPSFLLIPSNPATVIGDSPHFNPLWSPVPSPTLLLKSNFPPVSFFLRLTASRHSHLMINPFIILSLFKEAPCPLCPLLPLQRRKLRSPWHYHFFSHLVYISKLCLCTVLSCFYFQVINTSLRVSLSFSSLTSLHIRLKLRHLQHQFLWRTYYYISMPKAIHGPP